MFLSLLALALPAHAVVYGGNPGITVRIAHVPDDLDYGVATAVKVRLHACGGGFTDYWIGEAVDPVAGFTIPVDAGNWCAAVVYWEDEPVLYGNSYVIAATETSHGGALVANGPTLDPFYHTVIQGVVYGGNPEVILRIE